MFIDVCHLIEQVMDTKSRFTPVYVLQAAVFSKLYT